MQLSENVTRQKTCKQCKHTYEGDDIEIAFFVKRQHGKSNYFSHCRLCAQDNRTKKSRGNRWRVKARRARARHAKKLGCTIQDLEEKHGWYLGVMAHDFEHAYDNECSQCHCLYSEMDGGFSDITIDIWDRRLEPGYENTRRMCKTCNLAKGIMTPEQWTRYKRMWRERAITLTNRLVPVQLGFNIQP